MTEPESEDQEVKPLPPNKYELLEYLLSFLKTDQELNPVLCGYFAKLINVFISSKHEEFFHYIYTHETLIEDFANHVYNRSISENLIKLIINDKIPMDIS